MDNEKRFHTFGDAVSSRDYYEKLKRRLWFKENKGRLIFAALTAIVCVATLVLVLMMI